MAQAVQQEPAWVLHSRAFRETSLILDCLTAQHGRISILAKGARGGKKSKRALLQPWQALQLSFSGKTELKTLTQAEPAGSALILQNDALYASFYINELVIRLVPQGEPMPEVFMAYQRCLTSLAEAWQLAIRQFELTLLDVLGYALPLTVTVDGESVQPEKIYTYRHEQGLMPASQHHHNELRITGQTALALGTGCVADAEPVEAARLMKYCLAYYLGNKPLQSRSLWKAYKSL